MKREDLAKVYQDAYVEAARAGRSPHQAHVDALEVVAQLATEARS